MKKISIATALIVTTFAFSAGSAEAVISTDVCKVPSIKASQAMVPFIKTPDKFLKDSLKSSHTIRNFKAVKSKDFAEAYFLAGEIVNKTTNKSSGIGVWFTPDGYAMSGPATKYSTLLSAKIGRTTWDDSGNGYKIKKDVSKKSHGYEEVLSCYK